MGFAEGGVFGRMKLSKNQISEELKNYSLGDLETKKLIYDDWNTIYHIKTSKGDYIFKVLNYQSRSEIGHELLVLGNISQKIPKVLPVKTRKGNDFLVSGKKLFIIFPFVNGTVFTNGSLLSDKSLIKLGKVFGLLHTSDPGKIIGKDLFSQVSKFFSKIATNSPIKDISSKTIAYLKGNGWSSNKFPKGFIHGDLHTENLIFQGNDVMAVLDFEDAHIGSFIYDIGLSIIDTCFTGKGISEKRINKFVSGYELIRKLSALEKDSLKDAALFGGLYALHFQIKKDGAHDKNLLNSQITKRFVILFNQIVGGAK